MDNREVEKGTCNGRRSPAIYVLTSLLTLRGHMQEQFLHLPFRWDQNIKWDTFTFYKVSWLLSSSPPPPLSVPSRPKENTHNSQSGHLSLKPRYFKILALCLLLFSQRHQMVAKKWKNKSWSLLCISFKMFTSNQRFNWRASFPLTQYCCDF